MFTCLRNFCEWSTCPAHPEATCRVNPCGGCKVEFVDKDGNVVDCHEGIYPRLTYVKSEKYPIKNLLFCVKNGQVALLGICLKKNSLEGSDLKLLSLLRHYYDNLLLASVFD